MKSEYDVIIVGAGPAGCGAALSLARKGRRVLLMDKARFPREKACGDGLSPPALDVLERMGLLPEVAARAPWSVEAMRFHSPAGHAVTAPFSHLACANRKGFVFPRRDFDLLLWENVRKRPEVDARENCEAIGLVLNSASAAGVAARDRGEAREFRGKVVIGADGVYSNIAAAISFPRRIPRDYSFAIRAYFENVEGLGKEIEIHCAASLLPGYGWIFPTGESSANVGVGIAARALGKKNLKKLFAGFLSDRHLKERFRSARMVEGSLRAWLIPMGSFGRRRSRGNVLLAGDAGGFADVLTGEGIYHALRGGECAAQAAEQTLGLKTGDGRAGELYEKLWRRIFPPAESWLGSMIQRRVVGEFFLNFHVRRASGKPAMARNLASILCHQKTKMRLLF